MFFRRIIDVLDDIVNVGKNVYAIYGRETFGDWSVVLYNMDCNDTAAVEESKSINMFLEKHPGVKGFLLNGLIPQVVIHYHCLNNNNKNVLHKQTKNVFYLDLRLN